MAKAAFLDRDGTINIDKDYVYKIEDFEFIPGAVKGLGILQKLGFLLIIITNQSGIARGYYTEPDYRKLDHWLKTELKKKGVIISASYYCPHLADSRIPAYRQKCNCRKPKTGLFERAVKEFGLNSKECISIGDRERDLAFASISGGKGYLLGDNGDFKDLLSCAEWLQRKDNEWK